MEQVRDKWSYRIASPREKFSWQIEEQKQEQEQEQKRDHEKVDLEQPQKVVAAPERESDDKRTSPSEPPNISVGNRSFSLPWVHVGKFKQLTSDSHIVNTPQRIQKSDDAGQVLENNGGANNAQGLFDESSNRVGRGFDETERAYEEIKTVTNPNEHSEQTQVSLVGDVKDSFDNSRDDGSVSTGLPWKKERDLGSLAGGDNQRRERNDNTKVAESVIPEQTQKVVAAPEPESDDNSSSPSEPPNISIGNRSFSPPWVHLGKSRPSAFDSDVVIPKNRSQKGDDVGRVSANNAGDRFDVRSNRVERGFDENARANEQIETVTNPNGRLEQTHVSLVGDVSDIFEGSCDDDSVSTGLPWKRERKRDLGLWAGGENQRRGRNDKTNVAGIAIPEHELERLRCVALRMLERIEVGVAGITRALVDSIHEKWKVDEVVKLKFEGPSSMNMKRAHETLERKSGGLVIWRSGSSIVLFRGMAYKLHRLQQYAKQSQPDMDISDSKDSASQVNWRIGVEDSVRATKFSVSNFGGPREEPLEEELVALCELDQLLDGLGPRFKDWTGPDPLPIDADLLPCVVTGYQPPIRLLPYRTRPSLKNWKVTYVRRFARKMAPHFVLGRNRELQGLAKAMVKLWEGSAIAKIAIKRGVQNTCNERMAEELKKLTGGTLVSRTKDYMVFYRGNDYLPPPIVEKLTKRQKLWDIQQNEEEQVRENASGMTDSKTKNFKGLFVAGTLAETMAATSRWAKEQSSEDTEKMLRDSALARHASFVSYLEKKLTQAEGKINKAEKSLAKVQEDLEPKELPTDLETISDEERSLYRKIGLSMKPYVLLGRRDIFDGVIQNMHLHWKYREVVKILVSCRKKIAQVKHLTISLEAESGGVFVSLDKTTKGYAIIFYRGKNYQRPRETRPKNLLTKRQAFARSVELQRREGLKHHTRELQEKIEQLKSELRKMETVEENDDS